MPKVLDASHVLTEHISKLYKITLGREPDSAGLKHYRTIYQEGKKSLLQIREEMTGSSENIKRLNDLVSQDRRMEAVDCLYQALFNRSVKNDSGGLDAYVAAAHRPIEEVQADLLQSGEYR